MQTIQTWAPSKTFAGFPACTGFISEDMLRNTHILEVNVRVLREVWVHVSGAVGRSYTPVVTCFMLSTISNET